MTEIRNTFKQRKQHWQTSQRMTARFENKRIEDTIPGKGGGCA